MNRPAFQELLTDIEEDKVYIGKIVHKENVYEGEHDGIIDDITFERAKTFV